MAAANTTQHIGILYLPEGEEWAKYLGSYFLKDSRLKLEVVYFELGLENAEADVTSVTSSCYVTILLMTPDIMKWMPNIQILDNYLKVIPQHRGLVAISAFIEESEYLEIEKACSTSSRWMPMTMTESVSEINKMVAEIIGLFETVETVEKAEKAEKAEKHKLPSVPRKRSSLEKCKTPAELAFPECSAPEVRDVFPSKVFTAREKVVIVFKEPVIGTVHVSFKDINGEKHDTKKINPYSFRFRTPDPFPNSNMLEIFLDGKHITSKRFTFVKPTTSALQCIGYLMQTLGVDTTEELDQRLCDIFERSVPRDDILNKLFSSEEIQLMIDSSLKTNNDFPTLLHFAAAHGLSDFTSLLLEQPGSLAAFYMENNRRQNPAQMAQANHHYELARYMTDFADTSAVADACGIYVSMCGNELDDDYIDMRGKIKSSSSEDLYCRPLDDLVTPATSKPEAEEPPPPLPPARQTSLPPIPPQHRKMSLDSLNLSGTVKSRTAPPTPTRPNDVNNPQALAFHNPAAFLAQPLPQRQLAPAAIGSSSQQELIDIQQLVKSKEYTIDEAVMIFRSWKERPSSQSYKQRKKNLEELKSSTMINHPDNKTKKGLFNRMMSFRKTNRPNNEPVPSAPFAAPLYETYPIPTQFLSHNSATSGSATSGLHRVSSLSNSSSSSGTSRESGVSLNEIPENPSTDSEDEEQGKRPAPHRRGNKNNTSFNADKRKSKKDMFLEVSIYEKEVQLPPIPPRRNRKASQSSSSPPQLPKPRGSR